MCHNQCLFSLPLSLHFGSIRIPRHSFGMSNRTKVFSKMLLVTLKIDKCIVHLNLGQATYANIMLIYSNIILNYISKEQQLLKNIPFIILVK